MRDDDETEFVPLDRWEQEYKYFQKLIKVSPLCLIGCLIYLSKIYRKMQQLHFAPG